MLFIISMIGVIYCGRFQFDSIRAYRPRYDSDPIIIRSLSVLRLTPGRTAWLKLKYQHCLN